MTGVCVGLKPQSIEDITAIIALYRPGPMESIPRFIACKHNPEKVTYKHPALEPILSVTYGCIVYQEQVIQIFQQLGGYSLGQADMVRRAMSKKKAEGHRAGAGDLPPRRPGAEHRRLRRQRHPRGGGPEHLRRDLRLCQLRLQQGPRGVLRRGGLSDGLVQVPLPQGVHGGPADLACWTLSDKVAELYRRVQGAGTSALLPPDINQSEDGLHRLRGGHPLRPGGPEGCGPERHQQPAGGAGARVDPLQSFMDFCDRMFDHDLNRRALESLIQLRRL